MHSHNEITNVNKYDKLTPGFGYNIKQKQVAILPFNTNVSRQFYGN